MIDIVNLYILIVATFGFATLTFPWISALNPPVRISEKAIVVFGNFASFTLFVGFAFLADEWLRIAARARIAEWTTMVMQ